MFLFLAEKLYTHYSHPTEKTNCRVAYIVPAYLTGRLRCVYNVLQANVGQGDSWNNLPSFVYELHEIGKLNRDILSRGGMHIN